jgi:hypothetical protein
MGYPIAEALSTPKTLHSTSEPFPIGPVVATSVAALAFVFSLLIYRRHRKPTLLSK